MNIQSYPILVRIYLFFYKGLQKLFVLLSACFAGFWLGLLKKETLHLIDYYYYNKSEMYHNEAYNQRGLWNWEKKVVDNYFQKCKRLLVAGVGGGREVLALSQLGYDVDGFECHRQLTELAKKLTKQAGLTSNIQLAPRDQCPDSTKIYDGLVIGWGAYMLIQEREKRIAFLKKLRTQTQLQSPILVSFFSRSDAERRFKVIAIVGNVIRRLLKRNDLEIGDDLAPNYVHYFTKEEIASELHEGGFELGFYCTDGYGHAVGMATKQSDCVSSSSSVEVNNQQRDLVQTLKN